MLETVQAESNLGEPSLEATNRRILASAAILGGVTVLVKLALFGKDWLVAREFGASDQLDAFLVAFLIPSYALTVLAQSFAGAFMPAYIRVSQQQGSAAGLRLVSSVLARAIVCLLGAVLLLSAASRYLLPWLGTGFDAAKLELTQSLYYVLAGILVAAGLSAVFAAILNAHEHFRIVAWAPMAIPVATIGLFVASGYSIFALAAGTLLGYVLECAVLAVALSRHGLLPWPKWMPLDDNLRSLGVQFWPLMLGAALMSASPLVDQSMAASLGSGQVSILNYGNKVVALVLTIVAVSLSTVLFPRFSRLITAGRWDDLKHTINHYARLIVLGSLPVMAILALFAEPIVRLLFERGAFTPQTTAAVSYVQMWYVPQIPFYVLGVLGARLLNALDANQIVLRISALNLLLNVVGNYVFMHWLGVAGIALSTSVMYTVSMIAIFVAIRVKLAEASVKSR